MRNLDKKEKEKRRLIAFRIIIALLCFGVAFVFIRSYYFRYASISTVNRIIWI